MTAYNIEYDGTLKRLTAEHAMVKVKIFKEKVKSAFEISHPFVLTYGGAELNDDEALEDLALERNQVIRVRRRSIYEEAENKISKEYPSAKQSAKPFIFLSYNWSHKDLVLKLKSRLTAEGYSCWMDIDQMNAGDSLYPSIDEGIRGCQVFICCISKEYTASTNCRRELSLANNLNKRIIPLVIEKITWPPERIGPILAELLYVKFYTNNHENSAWPEQKFAELLQQLKSFSRMS